MGRPRKDDRAKLGTILWRKWTPRAWLSDLQVQLCSLESKGLWIDMLNLMMESPRVGRLLGPDGKKMTSVQLASIVRQSVDKVELCLAELKNNRVYSVDNKGVIFNRRIIREEKRRENGAISGEKGIENRERDQQGRVLPWADPGHESPTREERRERDKNKKAAGDLFGSKSARAQSKRNAPWTLDEKRQFGWNKVAENLGNDAAAWELIAQAAEGNAEAIARCKAVAKQIGVTWYNGKPLIGQRSNG